MPQITKFYIFLTNLNQNVYYSELIPDTLYDKHENSICEVGTLSSEDDNSDKGGILKPPL